MVVDTEVIKLNTLRLIAKTSDSILGIPFPAMKRMKQKTVAHCGPAVAEMLLSYIGKKVSQDKLVSKTGSTRKWFELNGVNVQELKRAVNRLFPDLEFWYKSESTLKDLSRAINEFKYPVGMEWQGIFEYDENVDYDASYGEEDDDPGHYGVITAINVKADKMRFADPERHYAGVDRRLKVSLFKKRWWDTNRVGKKVVKDNKMMFVIVPQGTSWPKKLGMKKGN